MNIDNLILKEQQKRQAESPFKLILEMVEELLDAGILVEEKGFVPAGAKTRDRVLRLPAIMATEISVGQRPSSEDRSQFELWMGNLGLDAGTDSSAVVRKLTAITNFFENPEDNLKNATIPETLSYLMFINQFVWMLKEFNASVAGFLWEPFLASLFGGESRQVPTSEGNIADIEIKFPGQASSPISLKILNSAGAVKGSFKDLVGHFANGGKEMRYVIVVKDQSEKRKTISGVTFYEFNITPENFMEWIGAVASEEKPELKTQSFTFEKALQKGGHRGIVVRVQTHRPQAKTEYEHPRLIMRSHLLTKGSEKRPDRTLSEKWYVVGEVRKADKDHPQGWIQMYGRESKQGIEALNIEGIPSDGEAEMNTPLKATVAKFGPGAKIKKNYTQRPGVDTKTSKGLWGGAEKMALWSELAKTMETEEYFKAILGQVPGIAAAPGVKGGDKTQFNITPNHYKGLGQKLGYLHITTGAVEDFFKDAASTLNEDLITMFNALADLTDNISRFFLVDCGTKACSKKDAGNRNSAGAQAIKDSKVLQGAVNDSVSGMTGEEAASGVDLSKGYGTPRKGKEGPTAFQNNENKTREDIIE